MEKKNIINVTPLSNRVTIPYGIKIERLYSIDGVNLEKPSSIEVISFGKEEELIKIGSKVIKGNNFNIEDNNFVTFQWKGDGITFEGLWEKILEAWEDYQECMAFPSLVFGVTGPGCTY